MFQFKLDSDVLGSLGSWGSYDAGIAAIAGEIADDAICLNSKTPHVRHEFCTTWTHHNLLAKGTLQRQCYCGHYVWVHIGPRAYGCWGTWSESYEEFEYCGLMLFLNDGCSYFVCLNSKFSNIYQIMFGIGAGLHAIACSSMILLDQDKQKWCKKWTKKKSAI